MTGVFFSLVIITGSCFICLFLSWIAKYYRLKSGSGIHHGYYFGSSALLIAGEVLSLGFMPEPVSGILGQCLVIAGGAGLMVVSLLLYRSMMSINRSMG